MGDQPDVQAGTEVSAKSAGRKKTMIFGGIFLGIMIAEGLGVALVVRQFSGGPAKAEAQDLAAEHGLNPNEGEKKPEDVEIEVATFRAQNSQARQVVMYDVKVVVSVSSDKEADIKAQLERKRAAIGDRFISTIRAADPQVLAEPDCATLRQQFHQILVEVLGGEESVKKVLIPQFNSYRAD
ncbi:MAG: hypothetical protein GX616_21360 [Planctomycetes bacterium]|nr:hypothetical protein [Planctomycetota bacterium]